MPSPDPPAPYTRLASWWWTTSTLFGGWLLDRQITGLSSPRYGFCAGRGAVPLAYKLAEGSVEVSKKAT